MGSPPQADQVAASRNIRDSNPVLGTKPRSNARLLYFNGFPKRFSEMGSPPQADL